MHDLVLAAVRPPVLEHVQRAAFPTDPATIFVYVLVVLAVGFIWYGNRGSRSKDGAAGEGPSDAPPRASQGPPADAHRKRPDGRGSGAIKWIQ